MAALSWTEIKDRALNFSMEWADAIHEEADAKPFLVEFFNVFGVSQRKIASFEYPVKKTDDSDGYIDLLWKGTLLVEMKSRGKNLDKAYKQAMDYIPGLKENEVPKYVIVCDFETFRLKDLETDKILEFKLKHFVKHVHNFGFIAGYQQHTYKEQDPVNIKAAGLMAKLHDKLKDIGYDGHALEVYLVRLLFCLFADDTTIFERDQFRDFIEDRTSEDGSDLAAHLGEFFAILNTPNNKRLKNLDEQLNAFPYVNGKLFAEVLPIASFDKSMRSLLIDCCALDWGKISPAIFGSMFQGVMNPEERRHIGAHYTSEKNILKLIKPLFLDGLWEEFRSIKDSKPKLIEFHRKLASLKFLDPACGCGNFLIITYRELRLLEMEILRILYHSDIHQLNISIDDMVYLDVDMMYGIEYEEWPARIAEVAMWLMDHQMNMMVSEEFGQYFVRLPLKKAPTICHGNALRIDWQTLVPPNELSYILGNPPFIGKKEQNAEQKTDMNRVFLKTKGTGVLDYVTAWYLKASQFIQGTNIKVAFVSTNSITQGEQVGVLWNILFNQYGIKIHFAHHTFKWSNEAKRNAAVHVVIIGFANFDTNYKRIFEYSTITDEPHEIKSKNINPYLFEGKDLFLVNRKKPICVVPEMNYGSMPIDDGHLIVSDEERKFALSKEPFIKDYIKPYTGGEEFINNKKRWCLWLVDAEPSLMKSSKFIQERVSLTKQFRMGSNRKATNNLSPYPTRFGEIRQPKSNYIIIPKVSSETRPYVPLGILKPNIITSGSALIISNYNLFHFGVLTSKMHMVWMKTVCGRMKSDYQYSAGIVYNNFPWPENPIEKQISTVEELAKVVLNTRLCFTQSILADLYDPITMPPSLRKAHEQLDKAVDLCYRPQPFPTEAKRMEFLFDLYEKYTASLFTTEKPKHKSKKKD